MIIYHRSAHLGCVQERSGTANCMDGVGPDVPTPRVQLRTTEMLFSVEPRRELEKLGFDGYEKLAFEELVEILLDAIAK